MLDVLAAFMPEPKVTMDGLPSDEEYLGKLAEMDIVMVRAVIKDFSHLIHRQHHPLDVYRRLKELQGMAKKHLLERMNGTQASVPQGDES